MLTEQQWQSDNNNKGGSVYVCVTIWNGLIQFKRVLEELSYKFNHTDIGEQLPLQDMIMILHHT